MKKIKIFLLVAVLFLVTFPVEAKEIDHFIATVDNDVVLEDTYNSSVATAGDSVELNGKVNGISLVAGNKVTFDGTSDYGVIVGNSVNINGTINNDLFLAGNIVTFDKNSRLQRDVVIVASDVEINGEINRNISIYASKVTFQDVTIKGNVKIYGTNITVSKNTVIEGNLSYPEDAVYKAEDGATIGNIIKTEPIQNEDDENFFATVSAKIWSFLSLIVVFAVISLLFPKVFNKINDKFEKMELGEVIEVFTKGLVAIILIPVIVVLLCCLMIGIPLGIIMILLYGIAIYLTTIFTAYLLGYKIWQKVFNKDINMLALGLIGLFILFILSLIPGVRTLVSILTTLIGLGLIVDIIKQKKE